MLPLIRIQGDSRTLPARLGQIMVGYVENPLNLAGNAAILMIQSLNSDLKLFSSIAITQELSPWLSICGSLRLVCCLALRSTSVLAPSLNRWDTSELWSRPHLGSTFVSAFVMAKCLPHGSLYVCPPPSPCPLRSSLLTLLQVPQAAAIQLRQRVQHQPGVAKLLHLLLSSVVWLKDLGSSFLLST